MVILFLILVIIISFVLGFIVLVQNPKGGGLAGNIAGFSNQFMGVKQTTDILEKGTWLFAAALGVVCLISSFFISGSSAVEDKTQNIGNPTQQTAPAPSQSQPRRERRTGSATAIRRRRRCHPASVCQGRRSPGSAPLTSTRYFLTARSIARPMVKTRFLMSVPGWMLVNPCSYWAVIASRLSARPKRRPVPSTAPRS